MAIIPKYHIVEREGPIISWLFYNPPQNLLNPQTGMELFGLIQEFYADPELRVGVFGSAMPDVFIRHYDVSDLVEKGTDAKEEKPAEPPPRRPGFIKGSKPIIAAINAPVAGGGMEMAMRFDFRFMSRNASMSQGEVHVGILPGGGGTQRLPRLVGMGRALELMLTGRPVYADEAERIGLITRACNPYLLMEETMNFARALAGLSPKAVHHIRQCVYEGMEMNIEDGLALESELFAELIASDEALELMKTYVGTGQKGAAALFEEQKKELERRLKEQEK